MATAVRSGDETFTVEDLRTLADVVAACWSAAVDLDWSVPAGTVEWSCLATADHAVDCVYAPAVFLASRRVDAYPPFGLNMMLGADATPALLVESLWLATRSALGRGPRCRSRGRGDPLPAAGADHRRASRLPAARRGGADPARARRGGRPRRPVRAAGGGVRSPPGAHATLADVDARVVSARLDRRPVERPARRIGSHRDGSAVNADSARLGGRRVTLVRPARSRRTSSSVSQARSASLRAPSRPTASRDFRATCGAPHLHVARKSGETRRRVRC